MTTTDRPLYLSAPGAFPRWQVEYHEGKPDLIRFAKWGRSGTKCLDQVARWVGGRWDPARWVPGDRVPKDIMRVVVGEILRREVVR